jgi:hypothetical protein
MSTEQSAVLIYIRDLLFSSKVVATARAESVPFKVVRDAPKLLETKAQRLLVDLNAEGALDTAIVWKQRHGGHVTGFVSHVNVDMIKRAKAAGIDRVMSNGAFSSQLPQIVREAQAPSGSDLEG